MELKEVVNPAEEYANKHNEQLHKLIDDFMKSGNQLMEIVAWDTDYKSYKYVVNAINRIARRNGYDQVKAYTRLGRAFIKRVHPRTGEEVSL